MAPLDEQQRAHEEDEEEQRRSSGLEARHAPDRLALAGAVAQAAHHLALLHRRCELSGEKAAHRSLGSRRFGFRMERTAFMAGKRDDLGALDGAFLDAQRSGAFDGEILHAVAHFSSVLLA